MLIRDIPSEQLEELKAAATRQGLSLQAYLLATVAAQSAYERRQHALRRTTDRLRGKKPLTTRDRAAMRRAIDTAMSAGPASSA